MYTVRPGKCLGNVPSLPHRHITDANEVFEGTSTLSPWKLQAVYLSWRVNAVSCSTP